MDHSACSFEGSRVQWDKLIITHPFTSEGGPIDLLLDVDSLGFLPDVLASGESLKRFGYLLHLVGRGEERSECLSSTLLRRSRLR